jgi:predicted nucleotidyltransferase
MRYEKYKALKRAKEYSKNVIDKLRTDFEENIKSQNFCVVTTGSFARCEASNASDLDYFIITKNNQKNIEPTDSCKTQIIGIINKYVKNETGDTETFGQDAVVNIEDLTTNIGGSKDGNAQFTRRMLFLLEGKCLYNVKLFNSFKKQLIGEYIKVTVSDHQLSRFFLNDIIRFYRTMTTDFEHKTSEKSKPWGLRNIKLTFSRKLLYFGGVITVAQTAQKTRDIKISETLKLLDMSPLERIEYIANYRVDKVFRLYDFFLEKISNDKIREELEKVKIDTDPKNNPEIFRELKNESKHFSWALSTLLREIYDEAHPIHHALIF